jgi:predicted NBD/HSP70 family sugar kinase
VKSIIPQNEGECYICGIRRCLETHHCIHGTGRRRLADEDGLTVSLCAVCHRALHDHGYHDRDLQQVAQKSWERVFGTREEFIQRYGRNYITE